MLERARLLGWYLPPNDPTDAYRPYDIPPEESSLELPPEPPAPRSWGYSDLIVVAVFAAVALLVLSVLGITAVFALNYFLGWDLKVEDPLVQGPLNVGIQILFWGALFAFIYGLITIKYRLPFGDSIGWRAFDGSAFQYFVRGPVLAIVVVLLSTFLPKVDEKLPFEKLLEEPMVLVMLAVFGILIAPLLEEMFFRGFLYPVFERSLGAAFAVFATSALFSLVHGVQYGWRWQNLLMLLGVGVVFGMLRARTASILPSTFLHAGYNATLFAAVFAAGEHIDKL